MQSPSDEELVHRIRADEQHSFAYLYHRYKHRVYAYCYRMLRHAQNAEDATQETFVKIHRSIHQLEDASSLQSWVFSIARNEAFTVLRRQRPAEDLETASESLWEEETALDQIVEEERTAIVRHCLGLLRPVYRELLILKEYEQLSYSEISAVTGTTESAVKSGLFKARRALRKRLEDVLNERDVS